MAPIGQIGRIGRIGPARAPRAAARVRRLGPRRGRRDAGFAILMVVLVLVGLVIIGAPFALSMRQEETASISFAARIRARLAAQGALAIAKAQLQRSHESDEQGYANQSEIIFNTPYMDDAGEFHVDLADGFPSAPTPAANVIANPAGTMWSATAQDEQGKINLKSASLALLTNLLLEIIGDAEDAGNPGQTLARTYAAVIVAYRSNNVLSSLSQLRSVLRAGSPPRLTEAQFQQLVRCLTLHSAPLAGEGTSTAPAIHPVNINTCSQLVLRALLRGIRLRGNATGVGEASTYEYDDDNDPSTAPATGTESAATFAELARRLRVIGTLSGSVSVPTSVPPATPSTITLTFTDPVAGDGFTNYFPVPPDPNPTGDGYWVSIDGDAVRYTAATYAGSDGGSLTATLGVTTLATDPAAAQIDRARSDTESEPVSVRLLLTDVSHDLTRLLDALVSTGKLSPDSRAAILANAINPRNSAVLDTATTTAPFCFQSYNTYTIEATGIANAADGRELARYSIREVAQVAPPTDLTITLDTQEDFDRSRQAATSPHVATWPYPTQVSDVGPKRDEPLDIRLHGRVGLQPVVYDSPTTFNFAVRFNGPLLEHALSGDPKVFGFSTGGTPPQTQSVVYYPDPYRALTTVKGEASDTSDLGTEGLHVGVVPIQSGATPSSETRSLVFPARPMATNPLTSTNFEVPNIEHDSWNIIEPFVLEMWVKFDPPGDQPGQFNYAEDHFLFDFAQKTFSNRIALYYDSTSASGGSLVLLVCDSTDQGLAALVRYPNITSSTFEPQRWYHLAAVVKGTHYNETALLVNGRCVAQGSVCDGRYIPCATFTSASGDTFTCSNLTGNEGTNVFKPFLWPPTGSAYVGGEIVGYTLSGGTLQCVRDTHHTRPLAHVPGTPVELHGYNDPVSRSTGNTEYIQDILLNTANEPTLLGKLSAELHPSALPALLDDGDDQTYKIKVMVDDGTGNMVEQEQDYTPPAAAVTQKQTTQYTTDVGKSTDTGKKYVSAAADDTDFAKLLTDGWLPICASVPCVIAPGTDVTDDTVQAAAGTDLFTAVAQDEKMTVFRRWDPTLGAAGDLSKSNRAVQNNEGLGFLVVSGNTPKPDGEIIRFSKAGVVLVWRYHPGDVSDPTKLTPDLWRKVAWYVGYLAGFDVYDQGTGAVTLAGGGRCCFGTTKDDVVEGARLTFDCVKLSDNSKLARGHIVRSGTITYKIPGTTQTVTLPAPNQEGRGVFQVYRIPDTDPTNPSFEWLSYTFPEFEPNDTDWHETQLLSGKFVFGITRSVGGSVPGGTATVGRDFSTVAPGESLKIMPVFFSYGSIPVADGSIPIVKSRGDWVTLTDWSGRHEEIEILHSHGAGVSFKTSVLDEYNYRWGPRLLKFPSGRLPTQPDKFFYLGSDAMRVNGTATELHDDETATAEPERPANATFDEVRIYRTSATRARLWDVKTNGGTADSAKDERGPAAAISGETAPFYIRIGDLESVARELTPAEIAAGATIPPFRFMPNGHAGGWPSEGYLKIDDECMYYRVIYRFPGTSPSASIKVLSDSPRDPDGYVTVYSPTDSVVHLDIPATEDPGFPPQGYLTLSNSYAIKTYWDRISEIETQYGPQGATLAAILADLAAGTSLRAADGSILGSAGSIGNQERLFYSKIEKHDDHWDLTIQHHSILDSPNPASPAKVLDPAAPPTWYRGGGAGASAHVSLITVELLILQRGCLGTTASNHPIGTALMPLENIRTTVMPRRLVQLRHNADGTFPTDGGKIVALPDSDTSFNLADPLDEYGIVIERAGHLPPEGYIQIGNEIIGYAQYAPGGSPIWGVKVSDGAATPTYEDNNYRVITGIKRLRQRYGTARVNYLDTLTPVNPKDAVPAYNADADTSQRIVRLVEPRYHDRYPRGDDGNYAPPTSDGRIGYYEFACTLPGALWRQIQWHEAKCDAATGTILTGTQGELGTSDPWDIEVTAQIDDAPAWDDTATDPVTSLPVATPVAWDAVAGRSDVVCSPATYSLKKPIIYRFDQPDDTNRINPIDATHWGQYGDRIRVRIYFRYRDYDPANGAAPNYNILWRTPWVDQLTIHYLAPTTVLEHREVPY